jgi:cellulose synthase/poly-beta-1,6-N-acetylglucosamine synthase-like glycosyltransferase
MKFTLVIPVAPERDIEILDSIKQLDYPKSEFHVVVIKSKNASSNRNKGAEKSKGEIIGFLDDDAILESDFLKNVEIFFAKYPWIDIAGGPQLTPKNEEGFAKISGYALTSKFGAAGVEGRYKKGKIKLNADERDLTSANLFVKKEVMNKVRFDENLWPGEDSKFIDDAKKHSLKVAYCPDFVIYHRRRATSKGLAKQIFNYGRTRTLKEGFFQTLKRPVFIVPSLFVIYLASLIVLTAVLNSAMFTLPLVLLFAPLGVYLVANLVFSAYEAIKNKDPSATLVLPYIFLAIHVSYGVGMIYGWLSKKK